MMIKVEEPQAEDRRMLRADQLLFTCLHLAPDPAQTRELVASGTTCIAYETVLETGMAIGITRNRGPDRFQVFLRLQAWPARPRSQAIDP